MTVIMIMVMAKQENKMKVEVFGTFYAEIEVEDEDRCQDMFLSVRKQLDVIETRLNDCIRFTPDEIKIVLEQ